MTIENNFETITLEVKDGVAFLAVNRPKQLNALNSLVLRELKAALTALNAKGTSVSSDAVKGLIFTGSGDKSFIAGADIKEMQGMTSSEAGDFAGLGQEVTLLFEQSPFPTIAAVHGFALGGGCEMAMACDLIFSTPSAIFGQPEVKLGLLPGFGGTQRLPKWVGRGRAKELIFTGRQIDEKEALAIGLTLGSFADKEALLAHCLKSIEKISRNSPLAVSLSKKALEEGTDLPTEQGLKSEKALFEQVFSSSDMKEGTTAFVEKRKAVFTGE